MKHMPREDAEAEVEKILSFCDVDKTGEINYTEFVAATINRKKLL